MTNSDIALHFCEAVPEHRSISNATARLGAWLIGAAHRTGGFPIELSLKQMQGGFIRDGVRVDGTGCRIETLKAAILWMEKNSLLESVQGGRSGGAHNFRIYTMVVR